MTVLWLLAVEAAIEAATGIALIICPQAVSGLLLGADLVGAGIAVGRIAGIALLSLGLVCWLSRQDANKTAALAAMLAYNVLVTAYLIYVGLGAALIGILLWPAIAIHAVLMVLVAYVWFIDQQSSLAFTKFLEKAINDRLWGRLVVRSAQVPAALGRVREHLEADLADAIAQGRLAIQDVELSADIVIGIWLQVTRGSLERRASPEFTRQALDAVLRALGVTQPRNRKRSSVAKIAAFE